MAEKYPHRFRCVPKTRRGGREAARTMPAVTSVNAACRRLPVEVIGNESWRLAPGSPRCQIVYRTSAIRLRFSSDVRADIEDYFETVGGDQREAGCRLFGHPSDRLIEITRLDGCSVGDDQGVWIDYTDVADSENALTAFGDVLVGDCHCQPAGWILASSRDVSNWAEIRRELEMAAFVGIVATRTRARWEFAGWVVRFASAAGDVAERCAPL